MPSLAGQSPNTPPRAWHAVAGPVRAPARARAGAHPRGPRDCGQRCRHRRNCRGRDYAGHDGPGARERAPLQSAAGATGIPAAVARLRVRHQRRHRAKLQVLLDLGRLAVHHRYWFTEDGTQPLAYACDYAPVGWPNISGAFATVSPARTGADHYVQLSFGAGAGSLGPGQSTGAIQNRIYQANFATMTQTNDYSFNAAGTALTANPHITVYDNGQLIYGTEP